MLKTIIRKSITQNPKAELKRLWIGLNCGTK